MISFPQAIILGLLQGLSELFPISSLGHSVILPSLLGWHIGQRDPFFLDFLVATHFATALVLFFFFRKDWAKILSGIASSLREREIKGIFSKLAWLLVVGTIPAGVLGLLFEDSLRAFFASSQFAAIFLTLNGFLLLGGELLRRKAKEKKDFAKADGRISKLSWIQAFKIGLLQSIALIPGFSRTGATLVGSLLSGLSHEDSLRFSFLMATPIIGAAALLKLPELFLVEKDFLGVALAGAFSAAISAYFAVKFLVKYFKTNTLVPFAIYCLLAGGLSTLYLLR